jgi:cytochrome b involved in lipid metabolism
MTVITNLCGQDATTGFNTRGGTGTHSASAHTLLGGYLIGTLSGPAPTPSPTPTPTPTSSTYTASQIAAHSSASDCWIVVGTNVYSVAAYLSFHPGGSYAISKLCGRDATTAFGNKGGIGKTHSAAANTTLGGFLIGTLSGAAPASAPLNPAPGSVYTTADVTAHSAATDCWIIISGKVYSVAPYVSLHPGGRTRITNLCGKDATTAFNNQGHSSRAKLILGGLLIGNYSATTGTTPTNGVCGSANGTTVSSAPTTGLCTTGTATAVSGTGPYTWSCTGSGGGTTASCSATAATVASPQTYTVTVNSSRTLSSSSLLVNAGDKIIFSYTSSSGEAKISISPSSVSSSSFTLDKDIKTKTVTINVTGAYTFTAQ